MKRSNAALALIVAGALMGGCGDEPSTGTASAEPGKSGSAQAKNSGAPKTSGTPTGGKTAEAAGKDPAPTPAAGGGEIIKHMPKQCDEGRVYANVGKLLSGESLATLDSLVAKGISDSKDAKKGEDALKALRDGGIDPVKSLKEVAVCANKDDKKTLVVLNVDMSKSEKPADTIAKAIEAGGEKAPKREESNGISFLQPKEGKAWIGIVGKDRIFVAEDKAMIEAAVKGGDGASEFGDAASHVIWAKMADKEISVMVKEAGADFDINVKGKVGAKEAEKAKADFEKLKPEIDKMADKLPMAKPLLPAAKNATITVDGDYATLTTKLPKAAITEFMTGLKDMKPKDLEGMMKGL